MQNIQFSEQILFALAATVKNVLSEYKYMITICTRLHSAAFKSIGVVFLQVSTLTGIDLRSLKRSANSNQVEVKMDAQIPQIAPSPSPITTNSFKQIKCEL